MRIKTTSLKDRSGDLSVHYSDKHTVRDVYAGLLTSSGHVVMGCEPIYMSVTAIEPGCVTVEPTIYTHRSERDGVEYEDVNICPSGTMEGGIQFKTAQFLAFADKVEAMAKAVRKDLRFV